MFDFVRAAYRFRSSLILAAFLCSPAFAQSTGTIAGTVQDPTGALVPAAEVQLTQEQTNAHFNAVTDEDGRFRFPNLPVGSYEVAATHPGFRRFVTQGIRVDADQTRQAAIILQVGETSESVEVTGAVGLVEAIGSTIRETVDQKRITELPLNGRNTLQLQLLVPGTVPGFAANATSLGQNEAVSVNGARGLSNNYMLDGADNNDPQLNTAAMVPNPDTLEEFSILTNSYGAEYGRSAGAVVNAITRSGTNVFHGSLWEFVRNDQFDARNFFSLVVPKLRRNQFGVSAGGPVLIPHLYHGRDRTFFFASYEGLRERRANTVSNLIVPTELERAGDFSKSARVPTDPNTKLPFPNSVIPSDRMDRAVLKFLDIFIPLPNASGGRHIFNSPFSQNRDQFVLRGDHNIGSNHRIYARYFDDHDLELNTAGLPILKSDVKYDTINAMINHTWTVSPSLLNTAQFSNSQTRLERGPLPVGDGVTYQSLGVNVVSDTPQYVTNWRGSVTGFWNMNQDNLVTIDRRTYQLQDRASWIHGAHMLKFGGEYRRATSDRNTANLTDPQFSFDGRFSSNAFADFLLGAPNRMDQGSLRVDAVRAPSLSFYVQDEWKVRRNLAITIGLRYDPLMPPYDANDHMSIFRPGEQSALYPLAPRGLLFVGDPRVPRGGVENDLNNLAPRLSVAWSPNSKMSVRAAYGIFYETPAIQQLSAFATSQPFSAQLQVNQPYSFSDPYRGRVNPFPYTAPKTAAERQNFSFLVPSVIGETIDPALSTGYMQQWNLSLQRETVGGIVVTAAYVGSKGTRLAIQRQLNPAVYRPGATTADIDARRIYAPSFGSISNYESNGFSTYHSAQFSLNKRFSHGFTMLANYTLAKSIDNVSTDTQGSVQDSRNLKPEKARSDFDIRQRFVASSLWEIPSPKTKLARHIFGGWQVNGILTLSTGGPLNITSGTDRALAGGGAQRPNLAGDPSLDSGRSTGERINRYFNTAAFVLPPVGSFGSSARNILTGPGILNLDSSLFRMFSITEGMRVQFRAEFFNMLNHANFAAPVTNFSSGAFGQIQTASAPRILQFALKLNF